MKSKLTAYLLLIFLGVFGAHKFYLGKTGMGFLYLVTLGLAGFGVLFDLFILSGQVDRYNMMFSRGQEQHIYINVTSQTQDNLPPTNNGTTEVKK